MARIHHIIGTLLLALALAFAGGAGAMPLAQGVSAVVICAETGAETIYLDATGAPAKPMMDCATCPDCLETSALGVALPQIGLGLGTQTAIRHRLPAAESLPRARHQRPETRGPPPVSPWTSDLAPVAAPLGAATREGRGTCHRHGQVQTEARI
jgi:hypothetical protein